MGWLFDHVLAFSSGEASLGASLLRLLKRWGRPYARCVERKERALIHVGRRRAVQASARWKARSPVDCGSMISRWAGYRCAADRARAGVVRGQLGSEIQVSKGSIHPLHAMPTRRVIICKQTFAVCHSAHGMDASLARRGPHPAMVGSITTRKGPLQFGLLNPRGGKLTPGVIYQAPGMNLPAYLTTLDLLQPVSPLHTNRSSHRPHHPRRLHGRQDAPNRPLHPPIAAGSGRREIEQH